MSRERSLAYFKIISISGDPYERGCQYGEQTKSIIEKSLEAFHSIIEYHNPRLSRGDLLKKAMQFVPFIEAYDNEIMEEIRDRSRHRE